MEEGEKIDDGTRMVTKVRGRQGLKDLNWVREAAMVLGKDQDVKVSGGLECGSRLNCHRNTSKEVSKR